MASRGRFSVTHYGPGMVDDPDHSTLVTIYDKPVGELGQFDWVDARVVLNSDEELDDLITVLLQAKAESDDVPVNTLISRGEIDPNDHGSALNRSDDDSAAIDQA